MLEILQMDQRQSWPVQILGSEPSSSSELCPPSRNLLGHIGIGVGSTHSHNIHMPIQHLQCLQACLEFCLALPQVRNHNHLQTLAFLEVVDVEGVV